MKKLVPLKMRLFLAMLEALALATAATVPAHAQEYPDKPIRMIAPFPPGGGVDVIARLIAQKLSLALGKPVIVDNRPGAAGNISTEAVARAQPDGYTIGIGTGSTLAGNPNLYRSLPFDVRKDLAPVGQIFSLPNFLIVDPSLGVSSLNELITLLRAKPGQISYGSAGSGHVMHLVAELMKSVANVDIVHVPYKGAAPALTDLLAGRIQIIFMPSLDAVRVIKSGKVRGLAVTAPSRSIVLPDVPTFAEAGLAGMELVSWAGVIAPAGTPKAIIDRLNSEIVKALALPDVREMLLSLGAPATPSTPAQFGSLIERDLQRWGELIRVSGAKVD